MFFDRIHLTIAQLRWHTSEIIAVLSKIHSKYVNALCGQKVEFFNPRAAGILQGSDVHYVTDKL